MKTLRTEELSCRQSVKYRFIEIFVFDYDSLPYLLSLFSWSGVTFPFAALHKITFNDQLVALLYPKKKKRKKKKKKKGCYQ